MRPSRNHIVPGIVVLVGLAIVLAMSLGGASGEAITWFGLALGILAGVAIAIVSGRKE